MTDHFVHVRGVGMCTNVEIQEVFATIKRLRKRNRELLQRIRNMEKLLADHGEPVPKITKRRKPTCRIG